MDYNYDPEYLFSPSQGEAKQERTITEHYFPTNFRYYCVFLEKFREIDFTGKKSYM